MIDFYLTLVLRMVLASILGGIIGYEREHMHRPAGFRTHVLVCVGSALVMVTSEFIFKEYAGHANMDPARLGAQVISGIGFLGAGTIIREGFNVKGLTTAASLWAVSCVGIAVGIGFYEGALAATVLIFITLILLKRLEIYFSKSNRFGTVYIQSLNLPDQVGRINSIFDNHNVYIKNIEFINDRKDRNLIIKMLVQFPPDVKRGLIVNDLQNLEGIQKVYEE